MNVKIASKPYNFRASTPQLLRFKSHDSITSERNKVHILKLKSNTYLKI